MVHELSPLHDKDGEVRGADHIRVDCPADDTWTGERDSAAYNADLARGLHSCQHPHQPQMIHWRIELSRLSMFMTD